MADHQKQTKRRGFNLLKPYLSPPTAWDKIYEWILGKARVIILLVEVVVVAAFIGKVVVDIQAKNLTELVTAKNGELSRFAVTVEPQIRKVQQKSESYLKLWNASSGYSAVLTEIHSYIPNTAAEIVIRITGDKVTIRGGDSLSSIAEIEGKMKNSNTFTDVSVPTLSSEESGVNIGEGTYVFDARIVKNQFRIFLN